MDRQHSILLVVFTVSPRRRSEPVPRGLRNMLEVLMVFIRDEVARKSIPEAPTATSATC